MEISRPFAAIWNIKIGVHFLGDILKLWYIRDILKIFDIFACDCDHEVKKL
jgi:hypothetical protein